MTYHNQFPSADPGSLRVAFVGEALGATEAARGLPFQGAAGQLLDQQIARVGLLRSRVFVGNVASVHPARNEFDSLDWNAPEVQDGVAALLADLVAFAPNLVVTLGNVPLHLFAIGNVAPLRRKRGNGYVYEWPRKVTQWRGSLFLSSERTTATLHYGVDPTFAVLPAASQVLRAGEGQPTEPDGTSWAAQTVPATDLSGELVQASAPAQCTTGVTRWKCLSTLHPAFVLRAWNELFNLQHDLKRARDEAATPNLNLPALDFDYGPR